MIQDSTEATVIPISSCERCRHLDARLEALQIERDELLLALARERQRANSLLLQFPTLPPLACAPPVNQGTPPLRYRVADRINDSIKRLLPFAHGAAKRFTFKLG